MDTSMDRLRNSRVTYRRLEEQVITALQDLREDSAYLRSLRELVMKFFQTAERVRNSLDPTDYYGKIARCY